MDHYSDYQPTLFRSWKEFALFVLVVAGATLSLALAPGASAQKATPSAAAVLCQQAS